MGIYGANLPKIWDISNYYRLRFLRYFTLLACLRKTMSSGHKNKKRSNRVCDFARAASLPLDYFISLSNSWQSWWHFIIMRATWNGPLKMLPLAG